MGDDAFQSNELMGRLAVMLTAAVLFDLEGITVKGAVATAFQIYDEVTAQHKLREESAQ